MMNNNNDFLCASQGANAAMMCEVDVCLLHSPKGLLTITSAPSMLRHVGGKDVEGQTSLQVLGSANPQTCLCKEFEQSGGMFYNKRDPSL